MTGKTFVLVQGAWEGGWCWRRVEDLLRKQGHRVFAPTLTGVADRSHLLAPGIGLNTHIADIVNLIEWEGLNDIVLVGHSYGGFVISGVAERVEKKIASIVYLDAFMPENGQALVDLTVPASAQNIRAAAERGEIAVPPLSAAFFKVNAKDADWLDRRSTPHPIRCFLDKAELTGARDRIAKKSYILASGYNGAQFVATRDRLRNDPSWKLYELPCGHHVMVDMPEQLVDVLLDVA